jgi:phosphoribosylglycinamide formyltransferase-1
MRRMQMCCMTTSPKKRVAILISGRGSNMQALVRAMRSPAFPAEPALVISNRPEAAGLVWAEANGLNAIAIDHKQFATRVAFEARLHQTLLDHRIDLICNAGFMRMLTGGFVDRWRDRHLNIHPSLLPAFPGLETHQRVLDQGVLITGCTVHFIRTEMDSGPIVAQAAVAVIPGDTADTLAARVLDAEHKLYPLALRLVASGAVTVINETAHFDVGVNQPMALFSPTLARPV